MEYEKLAQDEKGVEEFKSSLLGLNSTFKLKYRKAMKKIGGLVKAAMDKITKEGAL